MRALWIAAMWLLGSCVGDERDVFDIPFAVQLGGDVARCADRDAPGALHDLRLFVHDVRLVDASGRETRAELVSDGTFQSDRVALLDFEDGRGSCAGGTTGMNTRLRVRAPRGAYRELRFRVGVPFAQNHADAAMATAPLTAGTLHWGWRGGYKFVRFEAGRGRLHLGSTDCEGAFTRITRCGRPNRASVRLAGFRRGRTVDLRLDAWVGADCMGTSEPACGAAFASLGIDLARGAESGRASAFAWSTR